MENRTRRLKRCGGSRFLLSVRDLTLTTFEWIAQDTQYCTLIYNLGSVYPKMFKTFSHQQ